MKLPVIFIGGPQHWGLSGTMKILSWNCRGVGQPAIVPSLCELVKARRMDVIFMCETLSDSVRLEGVRCKLNFLHCFTVNCNSRSCGLCLLWNNNITCSLLSYSLHHIDMPIISDGVNWRFIGYYGHPECSWRILSWNLLRSLASQSY